MSGAPGADGDSGDKWIAPVRTELIAGDPIPEIGEVWADLAASAGTANIFYEAWMAEPSLALPEATGMTLLLGWSDLPDGSSRLDAVLPLQVRTAFGGKVRVALQNWEQRVRALGEPLIRAGQEAAFWRSALDTLDHSRGNGLYLRLSALVADSASTIALQAELVGRGIPCDVTRMHTRAVLRKGPSADDYIAANIRKKASKEHRRQRNRLAERGALVIDRLPAAAAAGPWIDDLLRLEMSGWKGREGVAAAADADAERCFRTVLVEAHRLGRLEFHRLRVGDEVLSLLAVITAPAVMAGSTAFQLKIAYDEAYAAFSPGVLLEMAYLDHALAPGGPDLVDSCARAGHPMIDRIWVDRLPIVSLAIPFGRRSSRLVVWAQRLVRRARARPQSPLVDQPDQGTDP